MRTKGQLRRAATVNQTACGWLAPMIIAAAFFAAACGSSAAPEAEAPADDVAQTNAAAEPEQNDETAPAELANCRPFPTYAEGNAYLADAPDRSELTDGVAGQPLIVRLQLVEVGSCAPLAGQAVDLWGAAPDGSYSGVDAFGTMTGDAGRSLRGRATTDEQGRVTFTTIYPGYGEGAPPHLTLTTPIDDARAFTARLLLDDEASASVFAGNAYGDWEQVPFRSVDEVASDAALRGSIVEPSEDGDTYVIDVVLGVDDRFLRQTPLPAAPPRVVADSGGSSERADTRPYAELPGELQAMFTEAGEQLEIDAESLYEEFRFVTNDAPPDLPAIADRLGVTLDELAAALPLLAGAAPQPG